MKYRSARQIWHDAYAPETGSGDMLSPQGTGSDNDARIWGHVLAGKAQSIIESLPPIHKSWGMYAYTESYSDADVLRICDHILNLTIQTGGTGSFKRVSRLLILIQMMLRQERRRYVTGDIEYSQAVIAARLGTDASNYSKSWAKVAERMSRVIDDIDRAALQPVAALID